MIPNFETGRKRRINQLNSSIWIENEKKKRRINLTAIYIPNIHTAFMPLLVKTI